MSCVALPRIGPAKRRKKVDASLSAAGKLRERRERNRLASQRRRDRFVEYEKSLREQVIQLREEAVELDVQHKNLLDEAQHLRATVQRMQSGADISILIDNFEPAVFPQQRVSMWMLVLALTLLFAGSNPKGTMPLPATTPALTQDVSWTILRPRRSCCWMEPTGRPPDPQRQHSVPIRQ